MGYNSVRQEQSYFSATWQPTSGFGDSRIPKDAASGPDGRNYHQAGPGQLFMIDRIFKVRCDSRFTLL